MLEQTEKDVVQGREERSVADTDSLKKSNPYYSTRSRPTRDTSNQEDKGYDDAPYVSKTQKKSLMGMGTRNRLQKNNHETSNSTEHDQLHHELRK